MPDDTIRVLRVIEYSGQRDIVKLQVDGSLDDGVALLPNGITIRVATVDDKSGVIRLLLPPSPADLAPAWPAVKRKTRT